MRLLPDIRVLEIAIQYRRGCRAFILERLYLLQRCTLARWRKTHPTAGAY